MPDATSEPVSGPELLTQPEDQSPAEAETFWLEVTVRGMPGPSYRWEYAGFAGASAPALRYQWFTPKGQSF